jgi:DNA-binding protein YbaB
MIVRRLGVEDELDAYRQDLVANYAERLSQIRRSRDLAFAVTASAQSRDGLISVQVGPHGQLLNVTLDPGAFQRMSPQRLARGLMELAKTATEDAVEQVRKIMGPVLPPGGIPADGDFLQLIPRASQTRAGERARGPE